MKDSDFDKLIADVERIYKDLDTENKVRLAGQLAIAQAVQGLADAIRDQKNGPR